MSDLVLITSVITTPDIPLSYSDVRSIYSASERFDQTIITIRSLRDKIPHCKICLIEGSFLSPKHETILQEITDFYVNIATDEALYQKIISPFKSLGEAILLCYAIDWIFSKNIPFQNLFKISGRYYLNETFEYSEFANDAICVIEDVVFNRENISTRLYKLPLEAVKEWSNFLKCFPEDQHMYVGAEIMFARFLKSTKQKKRFLTNLGVSGLLAISHDMVTE